MRGLVAWWVLAACAPAPPALDSPDLRVRTVLHEAPTNHGGTLQIQVDAAGDLDWTTSPPTGKNLHFDKGTSRTEHIGSRTFTTTTWIFKSKPGQYLIDPVCASWTTGDSDPQETCSTALFLDLGVATDRPDMVDIAEPSAVWQLPHLGWFAAAAGVAGLLLGGLLLALRKRPEPTLTAIDAEQPDQVAIRRWEAVYSDATLDEHSKAQALSHIFREYAEAVLHFPALKWTTTESVQHLQEMTSFDPANIHRAKKLLRATDLVKFADQHTGGDFFEEMDADLRAFVESTRPHQWSDGHPPTDEATADV